MELGLRAKFKREPVFHIATTQITDRQSRANRRFL